MKRIINTSEVLGKVELPAGACELCALAEAEFDEGAGRLVVRLQAFLRPADLLSKERHFRAGWLPRDETVTEAAGLEECRELAREIFQRWARKVREATPQLHPA